MNKVATGLLIGGLIGVMGVEYLNMNNSAKRKVMKTGKKMVSKAEGLMEDAAKDIW